MRSSLAFESSICRDYVTEKFYDPLVAGSVPVYLGTPNVREFAPAQDCFIDVTNFARPEALADYLTFLAGDEGAYAKYLAWKTEGLAPGFLYQVERQRLSGWCRLCLMLRNISPPCPGPRRPRLGGCDGSSRASAVHGSVGHGRFAPDHELLAP